MCGGRRGGAKGRGRRIRPLDPPPAASAFCYLSGRERGGGGSCTSCRTTCETARGAAGVGGGVAEDDGAENTTVCGARVAGGANASGGPISRENSVCGDPCRRSQHEARYTCSSLQATGTVTRLPRCPESTIKKSIDRQLAGTRRRPGPPASGPRPQLLLSFYPRP